MSAKSPSAGRCLHCGGPIPRGGRAGRKFCKPSCRTLAYRARQRAGDECAVEPAPAVNMLPAGAQAAPPPEDPPAAPVGVLVALPPELRELVTGMERQQAASGVTFQHLLEMVRSPGQREQDLRRQLDEAASLRRGLESERESLRDELAGMQQQLAKREQLGRQEEELRQRLLKLEHYIGLLTIEYRQQREADQAELAEQQRLCESLRGELVERRQRLEAPPSSVPPASRLLEELKQQLADAQRQAADAQRQQKEHAERVHQLTAEQHAAEQRYKTLQKKVYKLAPLMIAQPAPVEEPVSAAAPQLLWKNALSPFVEPIVRAMSELHAQAHGKQAAASDVYISVLTPFMLLLTHAQVAALLTRTSAQPEPSPQELVAQIKTSIQGAPEIYRVAVSDFAAQNEALLTVAAQVIQQTVKQHLKEVLSVIRPSDSRA